jgi:hypothetical protein
MRKIAFLMCVFGVSCASWAQAGQPSWANLSALHAGEKIQVVDMNSKKHTGTFVSVSNAAIAYKETAGEQTIQKQDVRIVTLMENKHRLRNTLIGSAVGAGAGAGVGASVWENNGFLQGKGTGAAVGAVIGAAGGAVIGVLLPGHKMIYTVN